MFDTTEKVHCKALEVDPSLARIQNEDGETFLHICNRFYMAPNMAPILALEIDPTLARIQDKRGRTFVHGSDAEVMLKALEVDPSLARIQDNDG